MDWVSQFLMKKTDRILMYCIGIGQILMGLINMMLGSGVIYSIFLMSVGIVLIVTSKPRK